MFCITIYICSLGMGTCVAATLAAKNFVKWMGTGSTCAAASLAAKNFDKQIGTCAAACLAAKNFVKQMENMSREKQVPILGNKLFHVHGKTFCPGAWKIRLSMIIENSFPPMVMGTTCQITSPTTCRNKGRKKVETKVEQNWCARVNVLLQGSRKEGPQT